MNNLLFETNKWMMKVTQLCLTLCDPMDYTDRGILQARILEWVAFPFSRRSPQLRDQTEVSHIAGGFFTSWATKVTVNIEEASCPRLATHLLLCSLVPNRPLTGTDPWPRCWGPLAYPNSSELVWFPLSINLNSSLYFQTSIICNLLDLNTFYTLY